MIPRLIQSSVKSALSEGAERKVVCLFGPRQSGKTTLMRGIYEDLSGRKAFLNGDYADDRALMLPERGALSRLAGGLDYLFIDEAQNIAEVGRVLKLLHDEFPCVRVLASGSASFDLRHKTGEPLTGRQLVFDLYPLCFAELDHGPAQVRVQLEHGLIYGGYPAIVSIDSVESKREGLRQLASDYLLKDIFAQVDLNRDRLADLLRLLAFQIGSEVSLSEIGSAARMDVKTVDRYLGFLEDAFVIVRLGAFSRNLRKEVAKSRKVYFMDLGIRNALLNAFNPPALRDDLGRLWENYLVVERMKILRYARIDHRGWFWRTYDRQEIDYVEESEGRLSAYEFKWNPAKKQRLPQVFRETYPDASTAVITPDQASAFLGFPQRG